ncbi:hypothetical protein MES4922_40119 [Mesorhizobium ventifaucium]|uniref:Lytic murein transglycosylase n=1 Tax=Mesorhizobium ventifaucium TaxID=666020 RepID=A0ABN8K994_9HYPH|nr:hypothetical protein MES4922_40119 [Mesorhizobium ventifaucium]
MNREVVHPRFWLGLPCPVPTPAGHMSPAGTPLAGGVFVSGLRRRTEAYAGPRQFLAVASKPSRAEE